MCKRIGLEKATAKKAKAENSVRYYHVFRRIISYDYNNLHNEREKKKHSRLQTCSLLCIIFSSQIARARASTYLTTTQRQRTAASQHVESGDKNIETRSQRNSCTYRERTECHSSKTPRSQNCWNNGCLPSTQKTRQR